MNKLHIDCLYGRRKFQKESSRICGIRHTCNVCKVSAGFQFCNARTDYGCASSVNGYLFDFSFCNHFSPPYIPDPDSILHPVIHLLYTMQLQIARFEYFISSSRNTRIFRDTPPARSIRRGCMQEALPSTNQTCRFHLNIFRRYRCLKLLQ